MNTKKCGDTSMKPNKQQNYSRVKQTILPYNKTILEYKQKMFFIRTELLHGRLRPMFFD